MHTHGTLYAFGNIITNKLSNKKWKKPIQVTHIYDIKVWQQKEKTEGGLNIYVTIKTPISIFNSLDQRFCFILFKFASLSLSRYIHSDGCPTVRKAERRFYWSS